MIYSQVIEHLEIALIELEYASADFTHRKVLSGLPPDLTDLEAVRAKIQAANRAMQLALEVMGGDRFDMTERAA